MTSRLLLSWDTALLEFALEKGIHINADNFQEIDVIAEELKALD